jgi:hypothetical protein
MKSLRSVVLFMAVLTTFVLTNAYAGESPSWKSYRNGYFQSAQGDIRVAFRGAEEIATCFSVNPKKFGVDDKAFNIRLGGEKFFCVHGTSALNRLAQSKELKVAGQSKHRKTSSSTALFGSETEQSCSIDRTGANGGAAERAPSTATGTQSKYFDADGNWVEDAVYVDWDQSLQDQWDLYGLGPGNQAQCLRTCDAAFGAMLRACFFFGPAAEGCFALAAIFYAGCVINCLTP